MISPDSLRPQDISAAINLSFLCLVLLQDGLRMEFDGSLDTILGGNVSDVPFFAEGLEFLSPPLTASPKSFDASETSKSVPCWVADVVCLNG